MSVILWDHLRTWQIDDSKCLSHGVSMYMEFEGRKAKGQLWPKINSNLSVEQNVKWTWPTKVYMMTGYNLTREMATALPSMQRF